MLPMRFLITAGPTREAIDPVRYITNRSSGKMGYCLAEAAAHDGHRILLVSGPTSLDIPHRHQYGECAYAAPANRQVWQSA